MKLVQVQTGQYITRHLTLESTLADVVGRRSWLVPLCHPRLDQGYPAVRWEAK